MAGLRDSNGKIVIDEAEAEADIRRIEQAKSKLLQVRQILDPKKLDASRMTGDTKDALEEKYLKINKDIDEWVDICNSSIKYIRNIVANYKRIDHEFAQKVEAK